MSFFTNPYLAAAQQPKQRQYQYATSPYAGNAYSDHLFATPHASYFGPSTVAAHTPSADIDEEEAIALAHLRAIQRRKETERLARQQAEREAVVAHLYEQQRAQAQAQAEARARAQLQAERQREAQAEAIRVHNEKIALAHYMRQMQIEAAQAQREEQYRRHQLSVLAAREQQQQAINEQRRRQCARNCAARRVQSSPSANNQAESHADVEAFNKWIGSLFGLQLPTESESGNKAESKAETNPVQSTPAPTPAPVAAAKPSEPAATTSTAAAEKKAEFPNAINDLLSSYLGLRVEPESKLGEAVSNKVPAGLNELLNQFGLEFFPDQPTQSETKEKKEEVAPTAESSTKSSAPAPAPVPAPIPAPAPAVAPAQSQSRSNGPVDLAEFLSGQHGLPPFIRDILGNVESAFKERSDPTYRDESVEGKGKGVADGEKKAPAPSSAAPADPAATPAPTVSPPTEPVQSTTAQSPPATANPDGEPETEINASADSLARLESIASELQLATETFTFPSNLSFATTTNTDSAPSLLYNKQNKPYHAQNNKLLQLLLQADGVASNGDREVRRKRKQIVKLVEGHIEALERKRDEYWTEVKERREQTGEVSENESWSSGSTSDHEEAVQHVEDVAAESSQEQDTKSPAEKPSTFADAAKSTPVESAESSPAPNANTQAPTVVVEEVKKDVAEKKENEEGYELL